MVKPCILLVDCRGGGIGHRLADIINSSGQFRLRRHEEPIQDLPTPRRAKALRERIARFKPQEVVVALGQLSLERDRRFLRSIVCEMLAVPVLVAAEACQPEDILELLSWGVSDFFVPPLNSLDVLTRMRRFLNPEKDEQRPAQHPRNNKSFEKLIGRSPELIEVIGTISAVSASDATVLISGETGTGKEICARAVHYDSPRAGKPFVSVNCGALPVDLVENELFGHQRAAYTGASTSAPGLIQEAEKGTLFLDEIDCLAHNAQVKILRFLQEKEFRRLGSTCTRKANVRVVAATNADPIQAVAKGHLRQDLYYRLNTVHISLPPLRDRREDIPLLASHFLAKYGREFNKPRLHLAHDALLALLSHDWPGNVREMEHVIERAVLLGRSRLLRASDLKLPRRFSFPEGDSFREAKARVVDHFERTYIESLLLTHDGNITLAAKAADKHRRAFWELMRKHEIDAGRFRVPTQSIAASA